MGYTTKIMGTKYTIALELDYNDWVLKLMLDGNIEEKVVLNKLNQSDLKSAVDTIIAEMQLPINHFQQQKIFEDLTKESPTIFSDNEANFGRPHPVEEDPFPYTSRPVPAGRQGINNTASTGQTQNVKKNSQPMSAASLQQNLISEYKSNIRQEDKVQVRQINIRELKSIEDESSQIQELVRSHREVQDTLKELDNRVASLEKLTMKLVEITELVLGNNTVSS